MEDVIGIGLVGASLTGLVQVIKDRFGTSSLATKALIVAFSVATGAAYFFARSTEYWPTVLGILASSQAVYGLFVKK